jgi:hypothetical protein
VVNEIGPKATARIPSDGIFRDSNDGRKHATLGEIAWIGIGLCCKDRGGRLKMGRTRAELVMSDFRWRHFAGEIILWAVRWYCRYGISYRDLEQMMGERGVPLDHSTIYRWVQKYAPEIEKRLRWQWRRPTIRQAKDETLAWLLWYNQSRMHSTLNHVSPVFV